MTFRILFAILAAGLSCAFAQISQPLQINSVLSKPPVKTTLLDGLLYKVAYAGPLSDTDTPGKVAAEATGKPEIAKGLSDWLKAQSKNLKGKGPQTINSITGFILTITVSEKLELSVAPYEVTNFGRDHNVLGKKGVLIREFSDFQCPYCKQFHDQVWAQYQKRFIDTGIARFSYRHLPLYAIHSKAYPAAMASECAANQGKFFVYHDLLFERGLDYLARAQDAKLNINTFKTCMANSDPYQVVFDDSQLAGQIEVQGTPSFFVGPFRIENPYDLDAVARYIRMAGAISR